MLVVGSIKVNTNYHRTPQAQRHRMSLADLTTQKEISDKQTTLRIRTEFILRQKTLVSKLCQIICTNSSNLGGIANSEHLSSLAVLTTIKEISENQNI
uniref:Uncharacterized protein n=1 Tax=Pararge aegeria TaxID=116150 RepID=S4PEH1_9NEOP